MRLQNGCPVQSLPIASVNRIHNLCCGMILLIRTPPDDQILGKNISTFSKKNFKRRLNMTACSTARRCQTGRQQNFMLIQYSHVCTTRPATPPENVDAIFTRGQRWVVYLCSEFFLGSAHSFARLAYAGAHPAFLWRIPRLLDHRFQFSYGIGTVLSLRPEMFEHTPHTIGGHGGGR